MWTAMNRGKDRERERPFIALVVILLGLGFGIISAHYSRNGSDFYNSEGILWPSPPKLNEFFLTDENNNPFTLADLKERWSIVFFGFSHCPDICPSTLTAMSKAETKLRSIPEFGDSGLLLFVSVDPNRDTTKILKKYISVFSPSMKAATGSEKELQILAKSMGAIFIKVGNTPNEYSVDHSAGLFFISPEGHLFTVLTPPILDLDIVERFTNAIDVHRKVL